MRDTTGQSAILDKRQRASYVRVRVQVGSTWKNLASLEGRNWLESVSYGETVDSPVQSAQFSVVQRVEKLSFSTLNDDSKLNAADGTILDLGNLFVIETATVAAGSSPDGISTWNEVFRGYINQIDWARNPIIVRGKDAGDKLQKQWLETEAIFPVSNTSSEAQLEAVCQDVLDYSRDQTTITPSLVWLGTTTVTTTDTSGAAAGDFIAFDTQGPFFEIDTVTLNTSYTILNPGSRAIPTGSGASTSVRIDAADRITLYSETGDGTTPFKAADSPGWQLNKWAQTQEPVLSVLQKLATQIGWQCRYRWVNSDFNLTLFEPDRSKTTPDDTLASAAYFQPERVALDDSGIRNKVAITYGTTPDDRTVVIRQDAASQTKYGVLYMNVTEGASSQIDTLTEAQRMGDAILNDLAEPSVEMSIPMPYYWPVETGDLIRFTANGEHFSSNQDLAVVGVSHSLGAKEGQGGTTTLNVRGTPSGGYKRWLALEGRPGLTTPADHRSDNAPESVNIEAHTGSITVTYDDPRAMDPPIDDWKLTECHVSTSSGFTPSSSTLKAYGRTTRFEISPLAPGETYYVKLIAVDNEDNKSQVSSQVTTATQKVGPYHTNQEEEGPILNRNSNFGVFTLDNTSNPPDAWKPSEEIGGFSVTNTWGTGDGEWYFDTTLARTGGSVLKFNDVAYSGGGGNDYFFESEVFPVEENTQIFLEGNIRHDGTYGNKVPLKWIIEWYDETLTYDSNDGIDNSLLGLDYPSTPPTLTANTWLYDRGWWTVPSGVAYGKIYFWVDVDDVSSQGGCPNIYWDRVTIKRAPARFALEFSHGSTNDRTVGSSTWVAPWLQSNADLDTAGAWTPGVSGSATEHDYTIPYDGEYSGLGVVYLTGSGLTSNTAGVKARIRVNGSTTISVGPISRRAGTTAEHALVSFGPILLNEGDTVRLEGWQNNGTSLTWDDEFCYLQITQQGDKK